MNHERDDDKPEADPGEATDSKDNNREPITTLVIELGQAIPSQQTREQEKDKAERRFRYRYLASQWSLVGITLGAVVIALCTLRSLTHSVDAANKQAAAAAIQVAVADEAMRVSNRPYVQISGTDKWDWVLDAKGKPTGIRLYLENVGNTPAMQTMACAGVANTGPSKECPHLGMRPRRVEVPIYGQPHKTATGYVNFVGPTIPAHETVPVFVGNIRAEEIRKGLADKMGFTAMGEFEYTNVFDEYCCEPFEVVFDHGEFATEPTVGWSIVCPQDRPNVCEPKSEKQPAEK